MADLWILAGQSNMQGVGLLVDVEPSADGVRAFVHGDRWEVAQEPLHWVLESIDPVHAQLQGVADDDLAAARENERATRDRGAGLAMTFAKTLRKHTGTDIDLVPCAHGGTTMGQWDPALKGQGGSSLYGAMLRRTQEALATSPQSRLAGVLWYQGESDADAAAGPHYTERMVTLIGSIREDLQAPELPFLMVQLGTFAIRERDDWAGNHWWGQIREAQRLLPTVVPHVQVVPAIDLELDDGIHIGTHGLKRLGRRLANVALADVHGQAAPTPIALGSISRTGDVIRVQFDGVNGSLRSGDPAGRVNGFAIEIDDAAPDPTHIFRARISPDDPTAVDLHLHAEVPADARVSYGWGLAPFCQLVDDADMAAPAFGPLPTA